MAQVPPQMSWIESFRSKDGQFQASERSFREHVFATAQALSEVIDEIDYTWRLDPFNHALPPFDRHITGIVDTLRPQPCW